MSISADKGSGLSEEVFEEGLIIPMLRLYDAGEPNEMLFDLIPATYALEKMIGDLRAQVATGWAGCRELERLCAEFGSPRVSDEITGRTEEGIRAGLRELPDGEWREEMMMDIDGIDEPQPLSSPSRSKAISSIRLHGRPRDPPAGQLPDQLLARYVAVPVKMICDPSLPNNQGTYRPITLTAPEGSLNPNIRSLFLAPKCRDAGRRTDVQDLLADRRSECRPIGLATDLAVLCDRQQAGW